jgi:hypothetical protein
VERRYIAIAIATALCVMIGGSTAAAEGQRDPIVVIGLRPAKKDLDGPTDLRRLGEAQRLRVVMNDAIRQLAHRPLIDDAGLRTALGVEYLVDFMDCRNKIACVARLVAKLKKTTTVGVYGEYFVANKQYQFRIRVIDLGSAKAVKEIEVKLEATDIEDRKVWTRELEALTDAITAEPAPVKPPEPKPPEPGTEGGTEPSEPPPDGSDVPELAPISTQGAASATDTSVAKDAFIDTSVLDAMSRGLIWHGYLQNYTAVGVRKGLKKELITFEERLQLEFASDIKQVRVVGKPELIFNVLDKKLDVQFREMFAVRDYKRFDVSIGQQIVTWGVTDFWPVVDVVNPRNYTELRNWRPIDEKLPVLALQSSVNLGPLTLHGLFVPIKPQSQFQLDRNKPYAIPVPVVEGTTIVTATSPTNLDNAGGGARIDLAGKGWKLSLYGLIGRDVLPAVHAETEPTTQVSRLVVDTDHIAMAAMSLQASIDTIGAILKTEAAYYRRMNDDCEGKDADIDGLPECFYLHRVPTGRATIALERKILPNLDAHLQFISEYTRPADIPTLPPGITFLAPGIPEQFAWNKIMTLRLQGDYAKSDFRPMAFAYWAIDDEAFFVNVDLEYHVADGLAFSLGGFWFHGYASDPKKNSFTMAGSLDASSNVYLRATAWF